MLSRLTLVGYRASGKTTIGRMIAARLGWPFVDADEALERRLGTTIADFFTGHGEAAFREQEARQLAELLAAAPPQVLATGGGCVLREDNRRLLRERGGLVVYLEAPVAFLQHRLRHHTGGRPSLTGATVADEIPLLLAQRDPLYREVATAVARADRAEKALVKELSAMVENSAKRTQNSD
jgi:shikimate kinase